MDSIVLPCHKRTAGTLMYYPDISISTHEPVYRSISPTDNLRIAIGAFGEGWHNYHHVFPWDYKAAELGNYKGNLTTGFIDMFAWLGQAYDLKTVSVEMINKRAARSGDGSRVPVPTGKDEILDEKDNTENDHGHSHDNAVWGWDDQDMPEEDIKDAQIFNKGD